MLGLTYFAARLKCPHCGTISDDDTRTAMQNKLLDRTESVTLRVGDYISDLTVNDFETEFLTVRLPRTNEQIHVLHTWICPTCNNTNWAEIVIENKKVVSIEDVRLSRESLGRTHFTKDWIDEDYKRFVGESMWTPEGVRPNFIETLKQHLPAS